MFYIQGGEQAEEETQRVIRVSKNQNENTLELIMLYEGESNENILPAAGDSDVNQITTDIQIYTAVVLDGSSASKIYKNGTQIQTGTIANDAITELYPTGHPTAEMAGVVVGGAINTSGVSNNGWNGKIYEVCFYNRNISSTERIELVSYFKSKYGIA